jgi:hypothetical protein
VPWLLDVASRFLLDHEQTRLAILVAHVTAAIDPREHPWNLMACCVGLVFLPRLVQNGWAARTLGPRDGRPGSGLEAAIISGAARWQAQLLDRPFRPGRLLGRFALFWAFAATNVSPALLFSTGIDGKTIGPAILDLAGGDAESRFRAAVLAVSAVLVNLTALGIALGVGVAPRAGDMVS